MSTAISSPPAVRSLRASRLTLVGGFIAVMAFGVAVYVILPDRTGAQSVVWAGLNLLGIAAILVGVKINRPARSRPWHLLAIGQTIYFVADVGFYPAKFLTEYAPGYPAAPDFLYLASYLFTLPALASLVMAGGRSKTRVNDLLDAAVVTSGVGVLFWVFFMSPYVHDAGLSGIAKVVSVGYPLMDILLLGVVMSLLFSGVRRSGSTTFLGLAVLAVLAADIFYSQAVLEGTFDYQSRILGLYVIAWTCFGAAALHPSMAAPQSEPDLASKKNQNRRALLLLGGALLAPLTNVINGQRAEPFDVSFVAGMSCFLIIMVAIRMSRLMVSVAEHERVESALFDSENRLMSLVQNTNSLIYLKDLEGRYTLANTAFKNAFGLENEDVIGKTNHDLFPLEVADASRAADLKTVETKEIVEYEQWVPQPDGVHTYLSVKFPVADRDGEVYAIGGIATDITERKKVEGELDEMNKLLNRSNEDLEHFAYIASHDLQEPLRKVATFCQLLQRRYSGQLDEKADQYIEFAVDGAKRMQELISDLLSYSRVDTQGKELHPVPADSALDRALANLQSAVFDTGAAIQREALPTVCADGSQLALLFQNLVGNALKFRKPDGQPNVKISARREGDMWWFSVADNGIGFSPEYAERIFVMFERLHGRAEYAGTGIGLALCKKVVERHGGNIRAESEPGVGTTFHFSFPAVEGD